jgi:hypothetical protein
MKFLLICAFSLLQLLSTAIHCFSQVNSEKEPPVKLFLDCEDCDFNFVRQKLNFVPFVRDPKLADVHILVSDSETGSGGKKYYLNFIGLNDFKNTNFEYTITTKQSDTENDTRNALLKIIKIGILPYFARTTFVNQVNIDLEESEERVAGDMVIDRWNKWVFKLSTGGEFQKEESQNEYTLETEASAEKITEEWKTSLVGTYEINHENYYDDGEKITNQQDSREITAEFIKSLNEKWSGGIFAEYAARSYLNIENKFGTSAGIEYNIFPWKDCNRRIFAIRYSAGVSYSKYLEETIYDQLKEVLWSESLKINLELIQPWGEVSVGLKGSHYFHDFSKNRLTLESDLSIRVTKNLSVFCEMESQLVHDQMYLAKGNASLEDLLLKRKKLATTYELSGQIGFRFTFGSIYNNVVNERF